MMAADPLQFKELVHDSLRRQVAAIRRLTDGGLFFWDYGNAFLLESKRAGAAVVSANDPNQFIYPSYVEAIMG
jgi:urocanate hydratase